jgi:ABC-2 type transport system permease protein
MINKIFALLKKDFLIELSYRISFLLNIFSIFAALIMFFFIDKLFGSRITPHLQEFGIPYFSYILLSLAFFSYIGVGLGSFAGRIRDEQMQGTLEALLMTPTKIPLLLFSMELWNLLFATVSVFIYFCFGILVFHIDFSQVNLLSAACVLLLTVISFSSLGIISASFILVFKRGNPVDWVLSTFEGTLGGVYFPIAVMPPTLQFFARFLPITYAIRAMELAVYRGYSLWQLNKELLALVIFCLCLTPLSLFIFNHALRHSRRHGTLGQY